MMATQSHAAASNTLVVVESPAKARTISRFLGTDYTVASSIGHIRDLPQSAADIPERVRGEDWARLAVNVDEGFTPLYIVPDRSKNVVRELKNLLKTSSELLLATDEDREGEAIAAHLVAVLKPEVPVRRLVFHEITQNAIEEALKNTRNIDDQLVQAQESRRVLDRLVGYLVSPVLWKKVGSGLSAGRVQSPAVRLIVDRERQRMAFVRAKFWGLTVELKTPRESDPLISARLITLNKQKIAEAADLTLPPENCRPHQKSNT